MTFKRTIQHFPENGGAGFTVEDRVSSDNTRKVGVALRQLPINAGTNPTQHVLLTAEEVYALVAALEELGYAMPR